MKRLLAVFIVLGFILSGCGSDSKNPESPGTPSIVLSGTAAAGAPIIGQVTVKDSSTPAKTKTALIEANGDYSVDVTDLLAPFILRAEGSVGGRTYKLHSYAESADLGGTVNITPFTDLIVANAAGQLASTLFDNGDFSALTPAEIAEQETALQTKLQAVFTALGVEAAVDLLHTAFSADHTALDAALDLIRIETDATTNIATIINIVDNTSIVDDIASPTDNATPLPVISDLGTAQTNRQAIFALFDNFSALFVSSLPSSTQLSPLFSADFLQSDQGASQFITELSTDPATIGLTFSHVVINALDETAGTATVTFNVTFNGVTDLEPETWQLSKNGGSWQMRGNQEIVDRWTDFLCAFSELGSGCGINLGADDFDAGNNPGGALVASAKVTLMRNDTPVPGGIVYMGVPTNGAAGQLRIYDNDFSDDFMSFGPGTNQIDSAIFQIGDNWQFELHTAPLDLTNPAAPTVTGTPIATYTTPILALPIANADSASFPGATQTTLDAFSALTKAGGNLSVSWSVPTGMTVDEVAIMLNDGSNSVDVWQWQPINPTTLTIDTSSLDPNASSYSTELRIYARDAEDRSFLRTYRGVTKELPDPTIGVWRATNGAEFSYLILFNDNNFLYAENDLEAQNPGKQGENGVEVGTYLPYDGTNITFNVLYDENDPGNDSGVGDIGTPAVIDGTLSNGNTTLTVAGGQLVLNAATFNPNTPITGVWRSTNGAEFSYLALFDDGTFLYAENDLEVDDPAVENGLEVGTYTYDGTNITFNIIYDDNDPGNDSGVGDIGTPSIIDATLSNENNTLTVAGGQVVLTRAF